MIARNALLLALALFSHPRNGPTFDFYPGYYSTLSLSSRVGPSLTLNSIKVATPDWEYDAVNCSATACTATYGSNLAKVEVGADITANVDTPLMSSDVGLKFADADYLQEASNTWAIGTKDIVLKGVFRSGALAASDEIVSAYDNSSTGVSVVVTSGGILRFVVGDGTGIVSVDTGAGTIVARTWYDFACYIDRSGSGECYVNGAATAAVVVSTRAASIPTSNKVTIGARSTGVNNADHTVVYLAAWTSDNWLDTHLQAADAMAFAQKVEGVYPVGASGSPVATVKTRTGTALLKKITSGVVSYFNVGATWARVQSDAATKGYTTGLSRTQKAFQSEDLATSWTLITGTDTINANAVADPYIDDSSKMDGIIGTNASNTEHGVTQVLDGGSNLAAVVYVQSGVFKAGTISFAKLCNDTIANGCAFFNISTCATSATVGAGVSSRGVESLGNGLCRVYILWTGTVAAHTARWSCAEADNDVLHAGNGVATECYIWGMEVDLQGGESPDSPIPTTTAAVVKNVEVLKFASAGNATDGSVGSIVCSYEYPPSTVIGSGSLISIDDGTSNNRIQLTGGPALFLGTGAASQASISTAGANAGTGTVITSAMDWRTNRVVLYRDGTIDGTPDTVATMFSVASSIDIGNLNSNGQAYNLLMNRCQIYSSPEHSRHR